MHAIEKSYILLTRRSRNLQSWDDLPLGRFTPQLDGQGALAVNRANPFRGITRQQSLCVLFKCSKDMGDVPPRPSDRSTPCATVPRADRDLHLSLNQEDSPGT